MQKTAPQSEILQAKAQAMAQTLDKQVIVVTKGEQQHVKVKSGYLYEISLKEGEVLTKEFSLIAKKQDSDLQVLLEHNTAVIFDDYLAVCATDLSCLVSLPSEDGTYHVVDGNFARLADGSKIVHVYGDEDALSLITKSQSGSFEQSFSEVFLSQDSISPLTGLLPLALLGGGGSSGGNSGGGIQSHQIDQGQR